MNYEKHRKVDELHVKAQELLDQISTYIEDIECTEWEFGEGMISQNIYDCEVKTKKALIKSLADEYKFIVENVILKEVKHG